MRLKPHVAGQLNAPRATLSNPGIGGSVGLRPVLMNIVSAVSCLTSPSFRRTSTDLGPVNLAPPSQAPALRSFPAYLRRICGPIYKIPFALHYRAQINRHWASLDTELRCSTGNIGHSSTGDHEFGWDAPYIRAFPSNQVSFDQGSSPDIVSRVGATVLYSSIPAQIPASGAKNSSARMGAGMIRD